MFSKLLRNVSKNEVPQFFIDYFTFNRDIVHRTTRQSNLLHLPKARIEAAKKSFYYNGCVVFNHFNS